MRRTSAFYFLILSKFGPPKVGKKVYSKTFKLFADFGCLLSHYNSPPTIALMLSKASSSISSRSFEITNDPLEYKVTDIGLTPFSISIVNWDIQFLYF